MNTPHRLAHVRSLALASLALLPCAAAQPLSPQHPAVGPGQPGALAPTGASSASLGLGPHSARPARPGLSHPAPKPVADLVLRNGAIYTVNPSQPWASAIAVRQGRIVFVGADSKAAQFIGPQTDVIDLQGRFVMPGVIDSHVHILEAFQAAAGGCSLLAGKAIPSYVADIQACGASPGNTGWVIGFGHSIFDLQQYMEAGGSPKTVLDLALPGKPAIFLEETSHSVWVNSLALALAGITAASIDPPGGLILREPGSSEPNGVLLESAGEMVMDLALTPNPTLMQLNYDALLDGLAFANRNGITALCDARCYWKRGYVEAWERARDEGTLSVRASVGLWAYPYELDDAQQIAKLTALYSNDPGSRLRFNQVKFYADGEISHTTASMLQPYVMDPLFFNDTLGGSQGISVFDEARLTSYLVQLEAVGFDAHIHAIGDRGVRSALNAIEAAAQISGGSTSPRHRLTHVTLVSAQDVNRFAQLGVTADLQMSDATAFPATFNFFFGIYLSSFVLNSEVHLLRTLYDSGARVVLSSDYDVGQISPFAGMERSLTRGLESLPSVAAAIAAYTIEPAYVMRREDEIGSLEKGKRGDLIVLDRNLLTIPPGQIDQAQVLLTLLDGDEVWRDPLF